MYRTQIQKGDRIVVSQGYEGRFGSLAEYADMVLIAGDVEEQVDDINYGAPGMSYSYFYIWHADVEGTDERRHFGRESTTHFERIPLWEEVLGPLAPDLPPMTLAQFRRLPEELEMLKGLIETTFRERPTFLRRPG